MFDDIKRVNHQHQLKPRKRKSFSRLFEKATDVSPSKLKKKSSSKISEKSTEPSSKKVVKNRSRMSKRRKFAAAADDLVNTACKLEMVSNLLLPEKCP